MTLSINWNSQDSSGRPQFSDHAPIRNANILSWNIMTQCRRTDTFTNNGFGVNETDADYQNRLSRLATAIANAVQRDSIDIIALQEAPNKSSPHFQYFIRRLQQVLGQDFVVGDHFADDTPNTSSSRLTIFNSKKLQARNVTNSHKLQLGQQKNRIQIIEFTENARPFLFANAHFALGNESHLAVYTLLNQGIILAGDLNGDVNYHLSSRPEPGNRVAGTNFSFDLRNNRINNPTSYDTIVTPQHYRPQATPQAAVPSRPRSEDPYAIYIQETLSAEMAADYCGYQPPPRARGNSPQRMGEMVFRSQAAANALLAALKAEGIVTNQSKRTFTNNRGQFTTLPLGEGEEMRLRQKAESLTSSLPQVKVVKPATTPKSSPVTRRRAAPATRTVAQTRAGSITEDASTSQAASTMRADPQVGPSEANLPENQQEQGTTVVEQTVSSNRRRLFQWLGHKNIAFVRHPLMLAAATIGIGLLYVTGFALTMIAATAVSYTALYAVSRFCTAVNQQAALFNARPDVWKSDNKVSYDLGEQSKQWAPYLQSFVKPSAYSSAYQVGLMNAQEQDYVTKKRCAY